MSSFKIYETEFGVKINGVSYGFDHVNSFVVDDPTVTRLLRGANASNKVGVPYNEGSKDPSRVTVSIIDMSLELKAVLDLAHKNKTRIDVWGIDSNNGNSKIAKQAILCTKPQQLSIDDSPESMDVVLLFDSFDVEEVFKV